MTRGDTPDRKLGFVVCTRQSRSNPPPINSSGQERPREHCQLIRWKSASRCATAIRGSKGGLLQPKASTQVPTKSLVNRVTGLNSCPSVPHDGFNLWFAPIASRFPTPFQQLGRGEFRCRMHRVGLVENHSTAAARTEDRPCAHGPAQLCREGCLPGAAAGAGAGFSKFYINNQNIILTDIEKKEWIAEKQDALNLNIKDNSVDVFICFRCLLRMFL